tara:strand:- start:4777 stop:5448 length:672 start_codon:yes stop_codon:yes gene_type:complete
MAAVTGIVTAVAGLAITVYQMDQANQAGKEADIAESQAKQEIAKVKAERKAAFEGLQAPDIMSSQNQATAQGMAEGVKSLSEGGAEASIGGASALVAAGRASDLEAAQKQAVLTAQTDQFIAQGLADIGEGDATIANAELSRAQIDQANAKQAKQEGTLALVQGAGNLAGSIGSATSLENKAQRNAKNAPNAANQTEAERILATYGSGTNPMGDWSELSSKVY